MRSRQGTWRRARAEHGAILIHVMIGSLVLMAITMFVVDQGVLFVGRRQAQSAADAAALAGAVAMAFDADDRTADGPAMTAATTVGRLNRVFGEAPTAMTMDVAFRGDGPCADVSCVRVDVHRNQSRGNPLPSWFGRLVGVFDQGVRATATARATPANAAACLKPWAVADSWGNPATNDPYPGAGYLPPSANGPGTGFTSQAADGLPVHHGRQLVLRLSDALQPSDPVSEIRVGSTLPLDLPDPDPLPAGGCAPGYDCTLRGCTSSIVALADQGDPCLAASVEEDGAVGGCLATIGGLDPLAHVGAVEALIAEDGGAWWDPVLNNGRGGVRDGQPRSPRVVQVALVDTAQLHPAVVAETCPGPACVVRVVNVAGFFVEGFCGGGGGALPFVREGHVMATCDEPGRESDVVGRLVNFPGVAVPGPPAGSAAFGRLVTLVR